jgi:hypothetical protein
MNSYFIVSGPGYYGDRCKVISSHRTVEAARKARKRYGLAYVIREGLMRKGDVFLRSAEPLYRQVEI